MQWNIAPEFVSLLIIFILMLYAHQYNVMPSLKNKMFRLCLKFVFAEIVVSIVSIYAIEYYATIPQFLNHLIQTFYFLASPMIAVLFYCYLISVILEDDPKTRRYFQTAWIPYAFYAVLVLVNPFTDFLFYFVVSHGFTFGDGFFLVYTVPAMYMVGMIVFILRHRKHLERSMTLILISFPVISLLMLVVQWIFPTVILSGSGAVIALLILYLYLQNKQIVIANRELAIQNEEIAKQVATRTRDLQTTKTLLNASLDSPKDMIILAIDRNYHYLYFNQAHQEAMKLAYGIDVKVGINLLEAVTLETDRVKAKTNYDLAMTGVPHSTIQEYGDAAASYFESFFNPIYNDKHEIIGATAFARNITDRMNSQKQLKESKERFEMMFSLSPDIAIITRLSDGVVIEVNEGFTQTSGYLRDEVLGKSSLGLNLYHDPADRQAVVDDLSKFGIVKNKEITFRRKDDRLFPGLMSSSIIRIDGIPHVSSIIRDITALKEVKTALQESNEKFRLLYSSMSQGLALHEIITDAKNRPIDYRFLSMNESFERLTGLKGSDIIGKTVMEVLPQTEDYWIKAYGRVALTGKPETFENYMRELGRYFGVTAYSPKPRQFAVLMDDITDRKNREEKILYINNHDFLTDLYNRRFFVEAFETYRDPDHLPLGVMMFDVNGLKIVNDAYGHDIGDLVLKTVATVLKETFGAESIVARIGGDEFAILLPNTTLETLQGFKDALRANIARKPLMNIMISLAIGYEIMTDSAITLDEMLKMAENQMYRHKLTEGVGIRNRAIQAILNTLTEKFEPERIHSERVGSYCRKIGEVLQLRPDDLKELTMAGMFHDIGKISIPDSILEKPGKLTPDEFETIKTHTRIGYQILRAADQYSDLAIHALSHHERWDGKGYPQGLKGDQIPLYSRIIGVVDAFEAMTAERPYKKPLTVDQAIEELKRGSGSQFNPDIAEMFIEQVLSK